MTDTIWVRTLGTIGYVNGERGTVRCVTRSLGQVTGAFVRLDEREAMLYVELVHSEKDGWMDVAASREIDRDEFDRLTGLADARRDLGWNLAA
jgi:hypothetical protein